jgi:hypothetical protein
VSSVSFWHEADIEEARIGATPNVRFAAAAALRVLLNLVRLPVFAILVLAAPLVRLALGALGFLSLLAALFYKFFSPLHPPFWSLLGFAVGCGLTLVLYERLLRLFS